MGNTIKELRNHLFDAIVSLKEESGADPKGAVAKANAIAKLGQTVINSAKLELDAIKMKRDHDDVVSEFLADAKQELPATPPPLHESNTVPQKLSLDALTYRHGVGMVLSFVANTYAVSVKSLQAAKKSSKSDTQDEKEEDARACAAFIIYEVLNLRNKNIIAKYIFGGRDNEDGTRWIKKAELSRKSDSTLKSCIEEMDNELGERFFFAVPDEATVVINTSIKPKLESDPKFFVF